MGGSEGRTSWWNRTSRKIPATTIVLECSSAETGVGPSIADGSHGFPFALPAEEVSKALGLFARLSA